MAFFDQFGAAQAANGQSAPNPQATNGPPGWNPAAWGNQPPNLAGGLQQFVGGPGPGNPQMAQLRAALAQNPQLAQLLRGGSLIGQGGQIQPNPDPRLVAQSGPMQANPGQMGPVPGGVGMMTPPSAMASQTAGGPAPAAGLMPPQPNLAGGLNPFLRR